MKIGKYRGTNTLLLVLEDSNDLDAYYQQYSGIASSKNANAIWGFNSQKSKSFEDYVAHEGDNASAEAKLLSMQMSINGGRHSMFDLCKISDKFIAEKYLALAKVIDRGEYCRINFKGGFCNITDFSDFDEVIDITNNSKALNSFLVVGTICDTAIEINNKSIIIENDSDISNEFINILHEEGIFNPQKITNFKLRTLVWKDQDYFDTFKQGIEKGLKNICIQTTGQDQLQIAKLTKLLNAIFTLYPDLKLNLYIATVDKETINKLPSTNNLKVTIL